jgi:hypothetical protein
MAPVMKGAEVATGTTGMQPVETPSCLTTTLYDLMTEIQDVVGTTNDALVVTTVVQLVRSGRLTWCGKARAHRNQAGPEATRARQGACRALRAQRRPRGKNVAGA